MPLRIHLIFLEQKDWILSRVIQKEHGWGSLISRKILMKTMNVYI